MIHPNLLYNAPTKTLKFVQIHFSSGVIYIIDDDVISKEYKVINDVLVLQNIRLDQYCMRWITYILYWVV